MSWRMQNDLPCIKDRLLKGNTGSTTMVVFKNGTGSTTRDDTSTKQLRSGPHINVSHQSFNISCTGWIKMTDYVIIVREGETIKSCYKIVATDAAVIFVKRNDQGMGIWLRINPYLQY